MENIFNFFAPVLYFATLLMPIAVPGPIASLLFVSYAKKKKLSIAHLFLLFIADGLSLFTISSTGYLRLPDLAFCLIPIAIAASFGILRFSWRILMQIGEEDLEFQKRIDVGIFLIYFLQVIIFLVAGINTSE